MQLLIDIVADRGRRKKIGSALSNMSTTPHQVLVVVLLFTAAQHVSAGDAVQVQFDDDFNAALADDSITEIELEAGQLYTVQATEDGTPIEVCRNLTFKTSEAGRGAGINFNNLINGVQVCNNTQMTFINLMLTGQAPSGVNADASNLDVYNVGLMLWPSVTGMPGSFFKFVNSTLTSFRPSCNEDDMIDWAIYLSKIYGNESVVLADDVSSIHLIGTHALQTVVAPYYKDMPRFPGPNDPVIGKYGIASTDTTFICNIWPYLFDDDRFAKLHMPSSVANIERSVEANMTEFYQGTLQDEFLTPAMPNADNITHVRRASTSASAPPPSTSTASDSSDDGGGFPWWGWVAIFVPVGLLLLLAAAAVLAFFLLRGRKKGGAGHRGGNTRNAKGVSKGVPSTAAAAAAGAAVVKGGSVDSSLDDSARKRSLAPGDSLNGSNSSAGKGKGKGAVLAGSAALAGGAAAAAGAAGVAATRDSSGNGRADATTGGDDVDVEEGVFGAASRGASHQQERQHQQVTPAEQAIGVWGTEPEGLRIGQLIGVGSYAKCYAGTWNGGKVAVKVLDPPTSNSRSSGTRYGSGSGATYRLPRSSSSGGKGSRCEDLELCLSVSHPNVVSMYRVWDRPLDDGPIHPASSTAASRSTGSRGKAGGSSDGGGGDASGESSREIPARSQRCILMEYCDMGTLHDAVKREALGGPDAAGAPPAVLRTLLDVANAMEHMHSQNIVHGDLKSANVLLRRQQGDPRGFVAKVADFGLSRFIDDGDAAYYTQHIGTAAYAAPEVLEKGRIGRASDVYSWAQVAWEVLAGETPHEGEGVGQVYYACVVEGRRPEPPRGCPPKLAALLAECWAEDPSARPSAAEVQRRLQAMLAEAEAS